MENMYLKVKEMISVRDAAFFYGLDADRIGLYPCMIHQHDQPGMEIGDRYYYCHECRQSGDVIDLVARMFVLSRQEAAEKLILDFGLLTTDSPPPSPSQKATPVALHTPSAGKSAPGS